MISEELIKKLGLTNPEQYMGRSFYYNTTVMTWPVEQLKGFKLWVSDGNYPNGEPSREGMYCVLVSHKLGFFIMEVTSQFLQECPEIVIEQIISAYEKRKRSGRGKYDLPGVAE